MSMQKPLLAEMTEQDEAGNILRTYILSSSSSSAVQQGDNGENNNNNEKYTTDKENKRIDVIVCLLFLFLSLLFANVIRNLQYKYKGYCQKKAINSLFAA
jgi:hypothetical protein